MDITVYVCLFIPCLFLHRFTKREKHSTTAEDNRAGRKSKIAVSC